MANFTFQCPHCGEPNAVDSVKLDSAIGCDKCALPFTTAVPAGRLMVQEGQAWRPASAQGAALSAEQDEAPVLTVNPAVYRENPIQTLILVVLVLAGLTVLIVYGNQIEQHMANAALAVAGALIAGVCGFILINRFVQSRFESLTVTTQRSIWARGLINRRTSEVQHDDIRNIQVHQNLIERFVKAGTVSISSAGQDDMEIVAQGIPNPHRVLDAIRTHQRRMVKPD